MLIIYRKADGQPLLEETVSSYFNKENYDSTNNYEHIVANYGGGKGDYDEIWVEDADIENKLFTHEYTIQNSEIIFGALKPIPEPEPIPPTIEEQLAEKDRQILELKAKQIATDRTIKENIETQQALIELLIDMGVL